MSATGASSSTFPTTSVAGINGLFGNTSIPTTLPAPPKLASTDALSFADWKVKFTGYCLMQGIEETVTMTFENGLELAREMDTTGRSSKTIEMLFKVLNAKAFGAILIAVEAVTGSTIFTEITTDQSRSENKDKFIDRNANHLWTKLCNLYEKKTVHSTLHVWKKLLSLNYKDGENPQLFKKSFDNLMLQLNQINDEILPGQKVSEGFKACIWLNALPAALESTAQTLLTQEKVSYDEIYQTLVRRYESNGSEKAVKAPKPVGSEVANAAVTNNSTPTGKPKSNPKIKCSFCKRTNHTEDRCWKKHGYPEDKKETKTDDDHSFCFMETSTQSASSKCKVEQAEPAQAAVDDEVAQAATEDGSMYLGARDEFILDSGASKHLVFDKTLMFNVQNVNPIRFTGILRNSVMVGETGSVRLDPNVVINNVACVNKAGANLISVGKVFDAGFKVDFFAEKAQIRKGKEVILTFKRTGGIYVFRRRSKKPTAPLPSIQLVPKPPNPKPAPNLQSPDPSASVERRTIPKKAGKVSSQSSETDQTRARLEAARKARNAAVEVASYFRVLADQE